MKTSCSYYNANTCRSCTYLEKDYLEQITTKEQVLKKSLNLDDSQLLPTVVSDTQGFRSKAKLIVTGTLDKPILGLAGESELDQGREILNCQLHHPMINQALPEIIAFIQAARLIPYNIQERKGELKGIIIFYSQSSQEMYLRFILRSKESLDRIKKNSPALLAQIPAIKSLSANIQPIAHALLEGEEEIFFSDLQFINQHISTFSIRLDPRGFAQTNEAVAARLYLTAAEWIKDLAPKKFCELYSGQGAFSFLAADFIQQGLGIEVNPQAVISANATAQARSLGHLHFLQANAATVEEELIKFAPDTVLVNPPRRGLGESLTYLARGNFEHLIYSSCSQQTLAQDLKLLSSRYHLVQAKIFDMFPHTAHFETLVLLKKI